MARRRKNEKRQKSIRYFDYSLLFLIIFLLCFGLIMLYSTSSYYGSTRFNDAAYYVKRQMYASALGIVAMLFISRIPYKFWMQLSTLAYFVALVLCTAVIFVGTSAKGQSRWLRIGPIQFQPSEIAKIAVIIFLATIIIWFLQSFDTHLNIVTDSKDSILALVGSLLAPLFAPLGFGNWKISTALITGFMAKESVVSTLTILSAVNILTPFTAAVFLVFTLLYTPCVAAIASVKRELGGKWAVGVAITQCVIAWLVAFLVRIVGLLIGLG